MIRIRDIALVITLVGGLVLTVCARPEAQSIPAAEFYKKNVVTMVVGFEPGGGSDYAARLLASYWSQATGGGIMVIKNMAGAGGLMATNYLYSAKPDGLTMGFGMVGTGFIMPVLTKDPAVRYDPKKLRWVVGVFHEPWTLCISTKRPYETVEDLKKAKGLKASTLAPFAVASIVQALFIDTFGLDGKIISGYKGGSDQALAAGRGEIDVAPLPAGVALDSVNKGFVKPPIVVMEQKRINALPNTPAFPQLAKLTQEQEARFKMVETATFISRVGATPPGVPEDRVKFMRDTFAKIAAMKDFEQQSKTMFPVGPTPMMGEELDAFMKDAFNVNIDLLNAMVRKYLAIK